MQDNWNFKGGKCFLEALAVLAELSDTAWAEDKFERRMGAA